MDPLTAAALKRLAVRAADWWIANRPFSKEKREARKERKRRRREGLPPIEENEMDRLLQFLAGFRTSTKAGVVGLVLPALALLPFYDELNAVLVQVCTNGDGPIAALVGAAVTWVTMFVTARVSKTPADPGVL